MTSDRRGKNERLHNYASCSSTLCNFHALHSHESLQELGKELLMRILETTGQSKERIDIGFFGARRHKLARVVFSFNLMSAYR
jgi:hypothetical protein